MKVLKIIGVILLSPLALFGGFNLILSIIALVVALTQQAEASTSYIIGLLFGALVLETLVIVGLLKLIRSLRKRKEINEGT